MIANAFPAVEQGMPVSPVEGLVLMKRHLKNGDEKAARSFAEQVGADMRSEMIELLRMAEAAKRMPVADRSADRVLFNRETGEPIKDEQEIHEFEPAKFASALAMLLEVQREEGVLMPAPVAVG